MISDDWRSIRSLPRHLLALNTSEYFVVSAWVALGYPVPWLTAGVLNVQIVLQTMQQRDKGTEQEVKTRNDLIKKLHETGDYDRLKHDVHAKLMLDDIWREEMLQQARRTVQLCGGVAEITLDELSNNFILIGAKSMPESIKKETLESIGSVWDSYGVDTK